MNTMKRFQKKISPLKYFSYIPIIIISIYIFSLFILNPLISSAANDFGLGWIPPDPNVLAELKNQSMGRPFFDILSPDELPTKVDLTDTMKDWSPVRNQGNRGSCVAFAVISMLEYHFGINYGEKIKLSPGYLYCIGRRLLGDNSCEPGPKDGLSIYLAIDYILMNDFVIDGILVEKGVPFECCFPYNQKNFCCNYDPFKRVLKKIFFLGNHSYFILQIRP